MARYPVTTRGQIGRATRHADGSERPTVPTFAAVRCTRGPGTYRQRRHRGSSSAMAMRRPRDPPRTIPGTPTAVRIREVPAARADAAGSSRPRPDHGAVPTAGDGCDPTRGAGQTAHRTSYRSRRLHSPRSAADTSARGYNPSPKCRSRARGDACNMAQLPADDPLAVTAGSGLGRHRSRERSRPS